MASSDSEGEGSWNPSIKRRVQRVQILDDSTNSDIICQASEEEFSDSFKSVINDSEDYADAVDAKDESKRTLLTSQNAYTPPSPPETEEDSLTGLNVRQSSEMQPSNNRTAVNTTPTQPTEDLDGDTTVEIFETSLEEELHPKRFPLPTASEETTEELLEPDILTETSTPLNVGGKKITTHFESLNVTAIPFERRNPDVSEGIVDRSGSSNSNSSEEWSPCHPSKQSRQKPKSSRVPNFAEEESEEEDIVMKGLQNITLNAVSTKRFTFHNGEKHNGEAEGAGRTNFSPDADVIEEVEDDDDDSEQLSANFEFDDHEPASAAASSNSDIQVLYDDDHARAPRSATSSKVSINFNDDSDELEVLTEKLKQIPLGKKPAPRKAIFLEQPPEIRQPLAGPYDPSKAKQEDFFGDVRRTITKLAETIETMPMPADNYDDVRLPPMRVQLYNHQIYGLEWLSWREQEFPGGGILADEMGLGKTIMILSLILKSKLDTSRNDVKENWVDPEEIGSCIPSRTTLVVCPLSCIVQWEKEVNSKAGAHNLSVTMFHGPQRVSSAARLAQADIVLTTYQTIASEIPKDTDQRRKGRSPLQRIYWHRIVLDEAHQIRNPKTVSAQAICKLTARHRWAVTGTPVHNRPEDFFSIAKFLRMTPFDDPKVWDFWIGMKQVKKSKEARDRLHTLGKALILRRTKEELQSSSKNNDVNKIPPKSIQVIKIDLDEDERKVYDHLMQFSQSLFKNFLKSKEEKERELQAAAMAYTAGRKKNKSTEGGEEVLFTHLFALIVRLRQCAVLPYLIDSMLEDDDDDSDLDDSAVKDEIENLISRKNPVFGVSYVSSKIRKILEDLEELREKSKATNGTGEMDKVVIVSSWVKLLRILNKHLQKRRFSTVFITGEDHVVERTENMRKFNENPGHPQIVLLSLQAGAVGINLTGGNHVFFVEPHWNPQIELQAQDRVHRFGQTKPVTIRRYIVNTTIEDRILDLQQDKIDLADGILANTKKARSGGLNIAQMRKLFDIN